MFRKSKTLLPLLLLVWFLIKLGQIPLTLVNSLASLLYKCYFLLSKINKLSPSEIFKKRKIKHEIQIKNSSIRGLRLHLLFSKKKRGRPRIQPFLPFYLGKLKKLLNKIFPKPLRIGVGLAIVALTLFAYSYFLIVIAHDLPSPDKLSNLQGPLTTTFYDRKGRLLYKLYEGRNRTLVSLKDLPPDLVDATIAIEDKHFYNHPGVDIFAVGRALLSNARDESVQGGSTITQQLIKNTLLTPERTLERKIKEVLLSFWAEKIFTKEEILSMYFNESPYGGTAWGIEAAAETYFNKKAKDLNLAESAFLAGLPASPTTYSPFGAHPELSKKRQRQVLNRMVEDGYISKSQSDEAAKLDLNFNTLNNQIKAPHFVMYTREILAKKYGEKVVSQGGLKVITTLDLDIQEMVEEVVKNEVASLLNLNVTNGAAMVTDAKTGQILAMVGSKNYFDLKLGNYNVTTAERQPGSSIKPVTYATAFKMGYSPGNILLDTPTVFKNAWETYAPINYDGKFHGAVTIRVALGSSYNVTAVKMLQIVGIQNMIQTAKDLGITTFKDPNRYGLSLTLGGGEVKLIDMMSVYGTLSQNGVKYEVSPVLMIADASGVIIEDNQTPQGSQVLAPGVAYLLTDILMDNKARTPAFGENSLLKIRNHQVAVKTGTTDSKKDNWTFGYTPEYVVGVWVGNNDSSPMDSSLTSGITGAAPIWNKIMNNLLIDKTPVIFKKPDDIVLASVDGRKDYIVSDLSQRSVVGMERKRVKDDKTKEEKDVITFTDPFTTVQSDQSGTTTMP
ncbi:PBP1A family penicillin-binding protein [Candidatus Daviesbacteria bacterium]|nr:PBP1A family penicillin-binding protein [Candidatus Daviesbacteria bacterium]